MKRTTLILDRKTISRCITVKGSIQAVESAVREYGRGKASMPAKIYLHLDAFNGDFRAMPAYIERIGRASLKWVNVHPDNRKKGLPAVMAVIILSDPRNGYPLCIMDGTLATSLRTGAIGAVAAKYLARKDSHIVSLVGCGEQACTQLTCLHELFDLHEVRIWGKNTTSTKGFVKKMGYLGIPLLVRRNVRRCVKGADIIVTTTPSRKPLVYLSWISPGTHINAIGADAPGKQELEPLILKSAKVVIDSWDQASHSGEINRSVRSGYIRHKDIHASIGEIAAGRRKGRMNVREITVFDSTGLAIQDTAIADLIYRTAKRKGLGKKISLL